MRCYFYIALLGLAALEGLEKNENSHPLKIAIVTPVTHASLEVMEKGFIEEVTAHCKRPVDCTTFNAQGSPTLMRGEMEEIFRNDFDLVCALGAQAAQMAKVTAKATQSKIPIVFTSVFNPSGLELSNFEKDGIEMTGVEELTPFEPSIKLLKQLGKPIRSILLVYDPSQYHLEEDRQRVASLLKEENIDLVPVAVFRSNEMTSKVNALIESADAVMILKDNIVVTALEALVRCCDRYKKILVASDLDSPRRGATLAYGVPERLYGEEAAKKARLILECQQRASQIPVTPIPLEEFHFTINLQRFDALQLSFPQDLKVEEVP